MTVLDESAASKLILRKLSQSFLLREKLPTNTLSKFFGSESFTAEIGWLRLSIRIEKEIRRHTSLRVPTMIIALVPSLFSALILDSVTFCYTNLHHLIFE
ncbi:hypothetical protein LINPERPRIM_LOCUS21331 [Linum perenne]